MIGLGLVSKFLRSDNNQGMFGVRVTATVTVKLGLALRI